MVSAVYVIYYTNRNGVGVCADRARVRARPGGVREAVEARLPERRATPPGGHGGQDHHDRRQVHAQSNTPSGVFKIIVPRLCDTQQPRLPS